MSLAIRRGGGPGDVLRQREDGGDQSLRGEA